MSFPTGIEFGRVVARYLLAVADGPDVGRLPDSAAPAGSVTFTPVPSYFHFPSATPPTTVIPQLVECSFDTDGYLLGPDGTVGVYLIATTYVVSVQLDSLSRPISFEIDVPAGDEIDLTPNTPV